MAEREASSYWEEQGFLLLVASFLSGPFALALNLGAGYALVKPACASGNAAILTAVAAVSLTMVIAGTWIGWSCLTRAGLADSDGGRREDRSYTMALVAIGLNATIGLFIVTSAIPQFFLSACD